MEDRPSEQQEGPTLEPTFSTSEDEDEGNEEDGNEDEGSEDEAAKTNRMQDEIIRNIRDHQLDLHDEAAQDDFKARYAWFLTGGAGGTTLIHKVLSEARDTDFKEWEPLLQIVLQNKPDILEDKDDRGETALHMAIRQRYGRIVKFLCENCTRLTQALRCSGPDGGTCVHAAIRRDIRDLTYLVAEADTGILGTQDKNGNTPLHAAVEFPRRLLGHQRVDVVRYLVEKYGDAIQTRNVDGLSPYQYYRKDWQTYFKQRMAKARRAVREDTGDEDHVSPKTERKTAGTLFPTRPGSILGLQTKPKSRARDQPIREPSDEIGLRLDQLSEAIETLLKVYCMRNFDRQEVLSLLYGSAASGLEIEFDLSEMSKPASLSSAVLESIAKNVRFESILRYVALPPTSVWEDNSLRQKDDPELGQRGRSVYLYLFDWLREHGVKRIIRVIVPDMDSMYPPHSDEAIEQALSGFDVEDWDWKKVNICSETIRTVAPNVRYVCLYTDGNNAVLREWSATDGLVLLKELKQITIVVVPGVESKSRIEKNLWDCERRIRSLRQELRIVLIYHVDDERIGRVKLDRPEDRWVDGMRNFARLMKTTSQDSTLESVKVALVDDGIDVSRRTTNIAGGFSFSTSNEPHSLARPWYFSEDGHGTKMADLICAPVPSVKLYVAKVDTKDWWNGVAKATMWAVDKKVDILCLGSNVDTEANHSSEAGQALQALRTARDHGIIMFCSATFPLQAAFGAFVIDAFVIGGEPSSPPDFQFPGHLSADEWEDEKLDPSSTATALATALAVVILHCLEKYAWDTAPNARSRREKRRLTLSRIFDSSSGDTGLVQPWDIFEPAFREQSSEGQERALRQIVNSFG